MTNFRYLKITFVLALPFMLALQHEAWGQLRLTRGLSKASQEAGASTAGLESSPAVQTPLAPSANEQRALDYIVVVVNSEPITRNEIALKQARLMTQFAAQGMKPAPESEMYKRVLDRAIEERALLQAAKEAGMRVSDEQVNEALLGIARQNQLSSVAMLQNKYESDGGNWRTYTAEIRNELLLLMAKEREIDAKVRVSESDIEAAMRAQNATRAAGLATVTANLAHILIALPDNASPQQVAQAQQKALQIAKVARTSPDFSKLVAEYSDAPDKAAGGVLGMRSIDRYPELFAPSIQSLSVGQTSEPIQSDAGFHILKVLAKKDSVQATMTQSKVRHILLPLSTELNEAQAKNRIRAFKNQIELKQNTFQSLAKDHSTDGSAAQGGDLGWVAPGVFVPEFEAAMDALPIGQLSEPLVTRFGVHLIEVTDRKEVLIPEREQREQIRAQLRERKAAEAYGLWVTETRNRAYVEYRNEQR
jgi:peptidyl-prolyl cis-trans isomerase SurA